MLTVSCPCTLAGLFIDALGDSSSRTLPPTSKVSLTFDDSERDEIPARIRATVSTFVLGFVGSRHVQRAAKPEARAGFFTSHLRLASCAKAPFFRSRLSPLQILSCFSPCLVGGPLLR